MIIQIRGASEGAVSDGAMIQDAVVIDRDDVDPRCCAKCTAVRALMQLSTEAILHGDTVVSYLMQISTAIFGGGTTAASKGVWTWWTTTNTATIGDFSEELGIGTLRPGNAPDDCCWRK